MLVPIHRPHAFALWIETPTPVQHLVAVHRASNKPTFKNSIVQRSACHRRGMGAKKSWTRMHRHLTCYSPTSGLATRATLAAPLMAARTQQGDNGSSCLVRALHAVMCTAAARRPGAITLPCAAMCASFGLAVAAHGGKAIQLLCCSFAMGTTPPIAPHHTASHHISYIEKGSVY
jgi:hypothetical protein